MKLGNTVKDYSQTEIDTMGRKISEFMVALKEVNAVVDAQLAKPDVSDGTPVIYVDMRPFAEFERTKDETMPLHLIVDTYERWVNVLWELAHMNIGNYKNTKVMEFVMRLRFQVATFQNFFTETKKK